MQLAARALENIYTMTDWPPKARTLPASLKDLGKSRADLWQFAANVALEKAMHENSDGVRPDRSVPFRTGRSDCVPDPELKMSPFAFEATKDEE